MRQLVPVAVLTSLTVWVLNAPVQTDTRIPCGPETVRNGSFDNVTGQFAPNTVDQYMTLPAGSGALSEWNISLPPQGSANGLVWADNNNKAGLKSPFSNYFIDITGYRDGQGLFVSQNYDSLAPGDYLVQVAVGYDRYRNPSGKVSVDWVLEWRDPTSPVIGAETTLGHGTVSTTGSSANNWELLHADSPVSVTGREKNLDLKFNATPGQTDSKYGTPLAFIGLTNVSMKALFEQGSRACTWGTKKPPIIKQPSPREIWRGPR